MSLLRVRSRRGAYVVLAAADARVGRQLDRDEAGARARASGRRSTSQRTWLAIVALFVVLAARGASLLAAAVARGRRHRRCFQTTLNFGATTMALAGGGAGRTSVLVFTMPFWTLLLAWPVLHERVRGAQWLAIALAFAGLVLVVEPWRLARRPRAASCGRCCRASAGRAARSR